MSDNSERGALATHKKKALSDNSDGNPLAKKALSVKMDNQQALSHIAERSANAFFHPWRTPFS